MIKFIKKLLSIFKVKANDAVTSIAGADTIERASLSQIKEKITEAKNQRDQLQARVQVMASKDINLEQDVKGLEEVIAFNVNKFKEDGDETAKQRGVAAVEAKQALEAAREQLGKDVAELSATVATINEMIKRLETVYNERSNSRRNAASRNKIAESTNAAADLINDLQGMGMGDGEGLQEQMREKEELAKIKLEQAIAGSDATPDAVKDTRNAMAKDSATKEFEDLLK